LETLGILAIFFILSLFPYALCTDYTIKLFYDKKN
jgi:hypothetical protein